MASLNPPAGGAPSYLLEEDFEGSGTGAGWTDAGTVDWDYTVGPLVGTESMRVNVTGAGADTRNDFTAQDDCWVYFRFKPASWGDFNRICYLQTSGFADVFAIGNDNAGAWRVYHGSIFVAAGAWSAGTEYHVWGHYVKGTGANGVAELYISTDGTRPGSPTVSLSNGDATGQASKIRFGPSDTATMDGQWDKLRVDDASIGSNPP